MRSPADAGDAESAGTIVDAQPSPGGGYDALAVIRLPFAESSEIRLANAEGEVLQISELPYQHAIKSDNV